MTLSDLSIDIQARLMNGDAPEDVARALEVPIDWIYTEIECDCESANDLADFIDEKMVG